MESNTPEQTLSDRFRDVNDALVGWWAANGGHERSRWQLVNLGKPRLGPQTPASHNGRCFLGFGSASHGSRHGKFRGFSNRLPQLIWENANDKNGKSDRTFYYLYPNAKFVSYQQNIWMNISGKLLRIAKNFLILTRPHSDPKDRTKKYTHERRHRTEIFIFKIFLVCSTGIHKQHPFQ